MTNEPTGSLPRVPPLERAESLGSARAIRGVVPSQGKSRWDARGPREADPYVHRGRIGRNLVSDQTSPDLTPGFHRSGRNLVSDQTFPDLTPGFHRSGRNLVSDQTFPDLTPGFHRSYDLGPHYPSAIPAGVSRGPR
jgi:hypothetical protein